MEHDRLARLLRPRRLDARLPLQRAEDAELGPKAPADPWDGATLEWAIPSPPPEHDFDRIPRVTSSRPYWDEKHETSEADRESKHWHPAEAHIHMPNPSYWPLVTAFGIFLFWVGFMVPEAASVPVAGAGVLVFLAGLYAWLHEPLE